MQTAPVMRGFPVSGFIIEMSGFLNPFISEHCTVISFLPERHKTGLMSGLLQSLAGIARVQ
jgi:hypothetical protein